MNRFLILLAPALLLTGGAMAQTAVTSRRSIVGYGEGVVSIRPDQMLINVAVTTQGRTAQEAADLNAARLTDVLAALRQLLGATADIKTISYSVNPNYRYPAGGGEPSITGYTANNTVRVTTSDMTAAGKIIDTAVKAGATTVNGLQFTLANADPSRQAALKLATQQARAHVEAIAQGLNVRLGGVLHAMEGVSSSPAPTYRLLFDPAVPGASAPTPVETGNLEIRANVTLQMELIQ